MGRALGILAVACIIVAIGIGIAALIRDRLSSPRSPSSKGGRLPRTASQLNERGRRLLRGATILITEAAASPGVQDTTKSMLDHWLKDNATPSIDEAKLLEGAGVLLVRLETEDGMVPTLNTNLRHRITVWLDEYLNRK